MAQKVDPTQEPPKLHGPTGPLITQNPESIGNMSAGNPNVIKAQFPRTRGLSSKCTTFVAGLIHGPRERSLGDKGEPGTAAYSLATKKGPEGTRPIKVGQTTAPVLVGSVKPSPLEVRITTAAKSAGTTI